MLKKISIMLLIVISSFSLLACETKTYDIVVSLYPQYAMVKRIVGDEALSYTLLLSPGVEAHDFEPTSKQIGLIQSSNLFIYTSNELETWASGILNDIPFAMNLEERTQYYKSLDNPNVSVSTDIQDVHYWVSLTNDIYMVKAVLEGIIAIDPTHSVTYQNNANALILELQAMQASYQALAIDYRPIYFVGHNIFQALKLEFGFNIISLTESFSPDADPSSSEILLMINEIMQSDTHYLYYDPFESDLLAKTIQSDLASLHNFSITLYPLNSLHNLTKTQSELGLSLIDLWQENLDNLRISFE